MFLAFDKWSSSWKIDYFMMFDNCLKQTWLTKFKFQVKLKEISKTAKSIA